jgi:hypothetical protein
VPPPSGHDCGRLARLRALASAPPAARRGERNFRKGIGMPGEPEEAETAPAAGTPAAAPEQDDAPPGAGHGFAAKVPAADGLPARDR